MSPPLDRLVTGAHRASQPSHAEARAASRRYSEQPSLFIGAPEPEAGRDPALELLQHLWQLNHSIERVSLQMEKTLGVTAQQRLVIRFLGRYPGITPSRLAALLCVDRSTVSTTLSRLDKKGLVSVRRDERDRRRVSLGLTAAGRALDGPTPHTVEAAVNEVLAECGSDEIAATQRVLLRLAQRLWPEPPAD
jgi:DNA-binding MarR family transcriptional regulator